MNKLRIGFDPLDCWGKEDFRDIIKTLVIDHDNIELYLITTSTSTNFVADVVSELKSIGKTDDTYWFNPNNVYMVNDVVGVIAKLSSFNILIHLMVDYPSVRQINNDIPLNLDTLIGCQAIGVVDLMDKYKLQMLYFTHFQFWLNQISKRLNTNNTKEC